MRITLQAINEIMALMFFQKFTIQALFTELKITEPMHILILFEYETITNPKFYRLFPVKNTYTHIKRCRIP